MQLNCWFGVYIIIWFGTGVRAKTCKQIQPARSLTRNWQLRKGTRKNLNARSAASGNELVTFSCWGAAFNFLLESFGIGSCLLIWCSICVSRSQRCSVHVEGHSQPSFHKTDPPVSLCIREFECLWRQNSQISFEATHLARSLQRLINIMHCLVECCTHIPTKTFAQGPRG